jgi:pyruvate/2-oxoglutarate dehydrogenase complex dihydrolipoamide acyltransferase (E2) component
LSPTHPHTGIRGAEHASGAAGFTLTPIPAERRPVLDRLSGASRRFQVHALVELDVREAAVRIRDADPRVSWTGFVIASVARAVAAHPQVNTRKAGNQVLSFDRVDIGATVERHWQGRTVLDIVMIAGADRKSCAEITEVLHAAKYGPGQPHRPTGLTRQIVRLPGPLRRAAIRAAGTRPSVAATFGPAVGVTSIGMFSDGWGWAIPLAPLTVIATVGGVADRAVVRDGHVVARPMLPLTLSFDHAVIDGAPATRFTETLRALVESAAAFDDPAAPPHDSPP